MAQMTSNRPYLVRALYDWICDNDLTPYLLVDAGFDGVRVPRQAVKDGRIVLNIAPRSVRQLELADDVISFQARFSGAPMLILAPMSAVLAIYAMENGQGMLFPPEETLSDDEAEPDSADPQVSQDSSAAEADEPFPKEGARPIKGSHLRVIK